MRSNSTVSFINLQGVVYVKEFCRAKIMQSDGTNFFPFSEGYRRWWNKACPPISSLLDMLLCHLVTAGPKENGGNNPAWGTKPGCSGSARGTISCQREMSLWGRIAQPQLCPCQPLRRLEGINCVMRQAILSLGGPQWMISVLHQADECLKGFSHTSQGSVLKQYWGECLNEAEKLPDAALALGSCQLKPSPKSTGARGPTVFQLSSWF